jgi:nucleotide-binding universal stress UspA family protein
MSYPGTGEKKGIKVTSRGILVAVDGSPLSEAVLPVVADLAADGQAVVTLLTVGEFPTATMEGKSVKTARPYVVMSATPAAQSSSGLPKYVETKTQAIERREEELSEYLEEKAEILRKRGIETRTVVQFGSPAERIVAYAARPEIDLVAMATHGHTGLRSLIFGSVARQVLRSGIRPVVLVRPDDADHGSRRKAHVKERPKAQRPTRARS